MIKYTIFFSVFWKKRPQNLNPQWKKYDTCPLESYLLYMHGMFRKVALLEISKSSLLMIFAGLQYIVCNGKFTENFQEVVSNMVLYQKYTDIQAAAFSLACF